MALPDDFRAQSRRRWGDQAPGWEASRDLLRTVTMPVSAWMIDAIDPQPGHTVLELAEIGRASCRERVSRCV